MCIVALASVAGTAFAQCSRHHGPIRHRAVCVSPRIVVRPAIAVRAVTGSKDRLAMAMAYLKEHEYLKASKYARMTGLSKSRAEAELDAFCTGKHNPLVKVRVHGKTRYALARP